MLSKLLTKAVELPMISSNATGRLMMMFAWFAWFEGRTDSANLEVQSRDYPLAFLIIEN